MANNLPLTGYEPNFFDDFHYPETTDIFLQEQSSDTKPSYSHDAELCDDTIGRALSSPLFIREREEPADRRQAYHSFEESLLPSHSLSVCHVSTERPVHELSSLSSCSREKPSRDSENEQIRILLERQEEQILADCRAEIQKHEFQADYDRRSIQKLNGIIESQRGEIYRAHQGDERLRRDQLLLHEQLSEQNRDLRVRGGLSHVPNQPASLPPYRDPGGVLSRPVGMLSRNDKPPDIWVTHGISGNVFVNPQASSSSPYPGGVNPWISNVTEDTPVLTSTETRYMW